MTNMVYMLALKQANAQRPEVRIVTWTNDELATDALPVNGFEHYKAKDYSLSHTPLSGLVYFLLFSNICFLVF